MLDDRFSTLDESVWVAAYLPAWSSRAEAAATWRIGAGGLHLSIPDDHRHWCADQHPTPLKVSAIQSGNRSGPVGSTDGQQPFLPDQRVREVQPQLLGAVPFRGRVEVECRAVIGPGSMFSAWMIGMEDAPDRCGELCLVEVFGAVPGAIGSGVHAFRDPALHEEFGTLDLDIDVAGWHTYAVDWRADGVDFAVDGRVVRTATQSPGYPMLLIIGLFEFPEEAPRTIEPELVVRRAAVSEAPPS